jgi:hypothetical protein
VVAFGESEATEGQAPMNVREAVATAKEYVSELFANEGLSDVGLEEVSLDEQTGHWLVTIGFARPWDKAASSFSAAIQSGLAPRR